MANLFDDVAADFAVERFDLLLARPEVRIERIVSTGQAAGGWYDQDWDEWVLLVEGSAGLEIAGKAVRRLDRGDHLLIAAGVRHRVAWTDSDRPTIWLAVHITDMKQAAR